MVRAQKSRYGRRKRIHKAGKACASFVRRTVIVAVAVGVGEDDADGDGDVRERGMRRWIVVLRQESELLRGVGHCRSAMQPWRRGRDVM